MKNSAQKHVCDCIFHHLAAGAAVLVLFWAHRCTQTDADKSERLSSGAAAALLKNMSFLMQIGHFLCFYLG